VVAQKIQKFHKMINSLTIWWLKWLNHTRVFADAVHPGVEQSFDEGLAGFEACAAGRPDGVHLVVPGGESSSLAVVQYYLEHYLSSPLIIMGNILNVMSNNISLHLCQIVFAVGISYLAHIFVYFNCKFAYLLVHLYHSVVFHIIVLYRYATWHKNFLLFYSIHQWQQINR